MDEDFDIRQEQISSSEKEFENALRPLSFNDFSGLVFQWEEQTMDTNLEGKCPCCGKDGVMDPYPYVGGTGGKGSSSKKGSRNDDVYSWTPAQTRDVK